MNSPNFQQKIRKIEILHFVHPYSSNLCKSPVRQSSSSRKKGGCQTFAESSLFPYRKQGSFSAAHWQGAVFSTQAVATLEKN